MQYFYKAQSIALKLGVMFMKKSLYIFTIFALVFCLLLTGCSSTDTTSNSSNIVPSSTPTTGIQEVPSKNIMVNYYGFTMKDVIELWGDDYVLNDYLHGGGWAGICYEDGRCPFTFYYLTGDIPTVCDVNEKLSGIGVNRFSNVSEYFIMEGITVAPSYEEISKLFDGEYYPDEMNGGNTFVSYDINNVKKLLINWREGSNSPSRLEIGFDYSS